MTDVLVRGYANGRARRQIILDEAATLFGEVGYRAASLREIATRVGISHPGLLHHFPTRAALMAGVVEDIVGRRLRVLVTPDPGHDEASDWDDLVDLVWDELQQPPFAVALELWVAARTDPDLRRALLPLQEGIFATVHRSITRLAGDGHPRAPMLVQFTIDLLTGSRLAGFLRPRAGTSAVVEAWKGALRELAGRG